MVQVIIEAQEVEGDLETRVPTKELALDQELVKRRKEISFKLISLHPGVDQASKLPGDFAKNAIIHLAFGSGHYRGSGGGRGFGDEGSQQGVGAPSPA